MAVTISIPPPERTPIFVTLVFCIESLAPETHDDVAYMWAYEGLIRSSTIPLRYLDALLQVADGHIEAYSGSKNPVHICFLMAVNSAREALMSQLKRGPVSETITTELKAEPEDRITRW